MSFFGNLMHNYMYGKAGQKDYTVSDMPATRLQLFGEVFKVRWGSMVGVNLLYMVFWLPAVIWSVVALYPLFFSEMPEGLTVQSYISAWLIGLIPCVFITGPFRAGKTYVLRNWARDEHSFVWSDFWGAVKDNWKQALVISLIDGVMPFLAFLGCSFYSQLSQNSSVVWLVPMCILIMVFVIWKLADMLLWTLMVTYELKLRDLIRNAVLMTMARLPHSVGIKLLTLVIPAVAIAVVWFAPSVIMYVLMIVGLLYFLFMPSFNGLIICSYANAMCEKYLNTRIAGAPTNIGLRPENWDDTEYRPEDDE